MQSEAKKQSFIGTWSGSVAVACLALMLGFASTGYGDVILGNWERADSNDGWVPGGDDPNAILVPDSNIGVTLGNGSLRVKPTVAGYWVLQWAGSPLNLTDASLQFDVTMVASEWPSQPWTKVADKIAINSDDPCGWKEWNNLATAINRDTGEPTSLDWGAWAGDANKTYTLDVSSYNATGATWMQIAVSIQGGNGAGSFYFDNFRLLTPAMIVSKCTVTAGKTQAWNDTDYSNMKDAFTASGTVVLPTDVNDINTVVVTITSTTDDYVAYTETLNDFNPTVVNSKHKYTHTAKTIKDEAGKITSLTLDFRKGTYAIAAKNIDLTGLACPFEVKFAMGSNELKGNAREAVVNGTKTIPTRLMRMYKDTLIVPSGKTKVKSSAKASSDSLSVTGEIADGNTTQPNLNNVPVVITWGDRNDANNVQTFTIPINSFKIPTTGHLYKLNKNITPTVTPVEDPNTKVSGTIDLDKCTFALSITKADLATVSGEAKFGISFGDFNETDDVTLP
ncbi:MAG: hypothetical protein ABSA64_02425 [Sedimentisphaerales bacterium]|jgi:hypothetical protein